MGDKASAGLAKAYIRMANELEGQRAEWTTEPPTEPGVYWARTKPDEIAGVADGPYTVIVDVWKSLDGKPVYGRVLYHMDSPASDFTHWLGPLAVPEPPK